MRIATVLKQPKFCTVLPALVVTTLTVGFDPVELVAVEFDLVEFDPVIVDPFTFDTTNCIAAVPYFWT